MKDYPLRIAILNDLHPSESPGAASVALSLANYISKSVDSCEFWCGSEKAQLEIGGASDSIKFAIYNASSREKTRFFRKLFEYWEWGSFFWVVKNFRSFNPDIIWVHQIGNIFPRFLLLFFKLRGTRVYSTLHDFTLIVPRKLYPSDFSFFSNDVNGFKFGEFTPFETGYARLYLRLRLVINRFLYNNCSKIVCISDMQAIIHKNFGFKVSDIIQNGVDECTVDHSAIEVPSGKVNLLFVGRLVGKGLHRAIHLIISNSQLHLSLVGGIELLHETRKSLDDSRFTYHGKLNPDELKRVYHFSDYVLVMSECFDVFPGVLMEALSHGCKVITSNSVGNSNLGVGESLTTVISSQTDLQNVVFQKSVKSKKLILPSHLGARDKYLNIFQQDYAGQ